MLDVGCGDLSFWEGRDCSKYLGLDISPTIIEKDRQLRPSWELKVHQAEVPLDVHARIVLCMDLLGHIMDDDSYVRILHNLCKYSTEWIFIHTPSRNPFTLRAAMRWAFWKLRDHKIPNVCLCLSGSDGKYQKYRRFASFLPIFWEASFELVGQQTKGANGMYAFKKSAR